MPGPEGNFYQELWKDFRQERDMITFVLYVCMYLFRQDFTLLPRLEYSGVILAHCSLDLLSSGDSSPQPQPPLAGTTGACHHTWLIFVIFVEMGFCYVASAGDLCFRRPF